MSRRARQIVASFKDEISGMSLDALHDLHVSLGRDLHKIESEKHLCRAKLDTVKSVMDEKRGNGDLGISDHAVLRYLERHKGLDVAAVRTEIRNLIGERKIFRPRKAEHYPVGECLVAVIPGGSIVATIYEDEQ